MQRAPADYFPLKWELPGGSVDVGVDESMLAGAVRELHEETGLVARVVRRGLAERRFEDGRWRQRVFEVEVLLEDGNDGQLPPPPPPPEVRLDPGEHVAWLWVTEGDVREGRCGEVVLEYADLEWRDVLLRAFEGHRVGESLRPFGLDGFW